MRKYGGLDPLVALLSNKENKPLLAAATGIYLLCCCFYLHLIKILNLTNQELFGNVRLQKRMLNDFKN